MKEWTEIQRRWFSEEKNKLENEKKRRYLHFDPRIFELTEVRAGKIFKSEYVCKNAFYPFIREDKKQRRYKRSEGKKIISVKIRPICYAAHSDALVYSFYAYLLNSFYEAFVTEKGISKEVLAYRRLGKKSTVDFANEVFHFIRGSRDCVAICFDVKGFFDNIDHAILKDQWQKVLGLERLPKDHFSIYKSITKFSYVEKDELITALGIDRRKLGKMTSYCSIGEFRSKIKGLIKTNSLKGIPQGAPISSTLSNIYMIDFDIDISRCVDGVGGMYRRYCDDIIVVVPIQEKDGMQKIIETRIKKLNLEISVEKTETRLFSGGSLAEKKCLQYLGLEFDGQSVYLRHRGIASFQRRMARAVGRALSHARKRNDKKISKYKIYARYSMFSRQNYLTYAKRAAVQLGSEKILAQVNGNKVMRRLKKLFKNGFESEKET